MSFTDKKTLSVAESVRKIMEASAKKADKDYDQDGKIESPKDEVWGSRLRAAKMAGKLKEEEQIDEAFPTVADGEKSLKAKEGKTTHGKITKTKTGMKHERDYDDQPEPEVKRGRGRPKKRLSEMRQEYHNYFEEEVDNETFTKELEDQKAKFDGKKKGADVAKASVQAVKVEEVEQIDELSKTTLGSYAKKASNSMVANALHSAYVRGSDTGHNLAVGKKGRQKDNSKLASKSHIEMKKREAGLGKAISRLSKEEVEQIDEADIYSIKNTKTGQIYHHSKYPINKDNPTYKKIKSKGGDHEHATIHKNGKPVNEETEQMDEVAPPGREDQVKALKKVPGIDNPWAVSWASYRKSHPKKSKD